MKLFKSFTHYKCQTRMEHPDVNGDCVNYKDAVDKVISMYIKGKAEADKRIKELEEALIELVTMSEDGFIESHNSGETREWETRMIKAIQKGRRLSTGEVSDELPKSRTNIS